jgi:hypothetical protein
MLSLFLVNRNSRRSVYKLFHVSFCLFTGRVALINSFVLVYKKRHVSSDSDQFCSKMAVEVMIIDVFP